jgi:hypothetical protein
MKTKTRDKNTTYGQWLSEYAQIKFQKGDRRNPENQDFRCGHCHQQVHSGAMWGHVQNRNHCPYCLWSRHLDLLKAGDRLCACKGWMRPVGLTYKRTPKKYAHELAGELMLVHQCQDCHRVSINRAAADDMTDRLWEVFELSLSLEHRQESILRKDDIRLLQREDAVFVRTLIFGRGWIDPANTANAMAASV